MPKLRLRDKHLLQRSVELFDRGAEVVVTIDGASATRMRDSFVIDGAIPSMRAFVDDLEFRVLGLIGIRAGLGPYAPLPVLDLDASTLEVRFRRPPRRVATVVDPSIVDDPVLAAVLALHAASGRRSSLGDIDLVVRPDSFPGYDPLPASAIVFASLGVDGVHWAVLAREGRIASDDPIVMVSPSDEVSRQVVAESFIDFICIGTSTRADRVRAALDAPRRSPNALEPLIRRFSWLRVGADEKRIDALTARYEDRLRPPP